MAIEAGQLLLHYKLIEKIGEGGMGAVWKAEDTKLHRMIALKILPEAMAADPERRMRFEREARTVAGLNHPNIVTLHSVEEADGVHFITMELVEGKTLANLIPDRGFTLNRLLEIAVPLADAVSSAHRAGVTHRDLKPDNIMFDGEGRLRVLDFGLAKLSEPVRPTGNTETATVAAETGEGKIVGTVAYMSPEQAEGKPVDHRSDIFSLGTILYEMAAGTRPFQGDTGMSTLSAILKDEPRSIVELKPALPRHSGRIIRRCLAKDPDRRYQTALDLRNELEELKGEIDSGEPEPARRKVSDRSGWSAGRWVMIVACVALVLLSTWVIREWTAPEPGPVQPRYRPVPRTSAIGQDSGINWSPGEEFITFDRVRKGSYDIMVLPVAGGEAQARVEGVGDQMASRWSPDGQYLAYISSAEPESFVYIVPPHGGTPQRLIETDLPTLEADTLGTAMGQRPWSLDSRSLLISRITESGQIAIFKVHRDDGTVVQISFPPSGHDDLSGSYSFDGASIAFERRGDGRGALMVMPSVGGDPEPLLADQFDNGMPAYRPGGRQILFLSDRRGMVSLWELDLETKDLNQVWSESHQIVSFGVSATNRIAYEPFWHDTFLFSVDVTTGERVQLTSHTKDNFGARFSPDGRTIAYHATRDGNSEIYLHYQDGSPETRITDDPGWDMYPDWSPDGRQLIFSSNRGGDHYKIYIANGDGGGVRMLLDQPVTVSASPYPVNSGLVSRWSPGGERIAYLVTDDDTISLWTVRPDGTGTEELIRNVESFDWYRDEDHAIFTRKQGSQSELIAINLRTGTERSLFTGPFMEMDVAPDGSAVAFCYGPGHMAMGLAVLELTPPDGPDGLPSAVGEPEYVVRTEGTWHVHNGGWSPDSNTIVYTQDQDYGDIYELVEEQ